MPQRDMGKLLLWILLAIVMRIRRRSLLFLGLGIGRRNFQHIIDRFLLRTLVRLSQAFMVRQKGVNAALRINSVQEAADVVFAVEHENKLREKAKSIVFSLADIFDQTAEEECQKLVDGMVKTINGLLALGYTVHMVEFTKSRDMSLYKKILKQLAVLDNVVLHPYRGDPYAMIEVFQQAQLCVCMRFHSLILAAVTHTPCCIIAYSEKMDDVAERLNLTDYAMQICPISNLYYGRLISFDEAKFNDILKRLIENREILRAQMKNMVSDLQRQAKTNWDVLSNVIDLYQKSDGIKIDKM